MRTWLSVFLLAVSLFAAYSSKAQDLTLNLDKEDVSCPGDSNGLVSVQLCGGSPPYTISFDGGPSANFTATAPNGWVDGFQTVSNVRARFFDVETDHLGNSYVIGEFTDTLNLLGQQLIAPNLFGGRFVMKVDSNFQLIWLKLEDGGETYFDRIEVDSISNVYLLARIDTNTTVFGQSVLASQNELNEAVVKLDPLGNLEWIHQVDGAHLHDLVIGPSQNIYYCGRIGNYPTFIVIGGDTLYPLLSNGAARGLLAKLDPDGNSLWATNSGLQILDFFHLAVGANEEIYVGGSIWHSAIVDTVPVNNSFPGNVLARYDSTGHCVWTLAIERDSYSISYQEIDAIEVGPDGFPVLVGWYYHDTIKIDSVVLTNDDQWAEIYAMRCDPDGNLLMAKSIGSAGTILVTREIQIMPNYDIFISGAFGDNLLWGCTYYEANGPNTNGYVGLIDTLGNEKWAVTGKTKWHSYNFRISKGAHNDLIMIGYFDDTLSLGNQLTYFSPGFLHHEGVLARFDPYPAPLPADTFAHLSVGWHTVTVFDNAGDSITDSIFVGEPNPFQSNETVQAVSAYGLSDGAINLAVTGGSPPYSYQWSNGDQSANPDSLMAGTYTVTITDTRGCTSLFSVLVTEPPPPLQIDLVVVNDSCEGDLAGSASVAIQHGYPPYTIAWSDGSFDTSIDGLSMGNYQVVVSDTSGAQIDTTFEVKLLTALVGFPTLGPDLRECPIEGSKLTLPDSSGLSYLWHDQSTSPEILLSESGVYAVTITDSIGCQFEDSMMVTITCPSTVDVPNVFSPNSDGINDLFLVRSKHVYGFEFHVQNRWGQQLFSTTRLKEGWDGTVNGLPVPANVYLWTIKHQDFQGNWKSQSGTVTLLR